MTITVERYCDRLKEEWDKFIDTSKAPHFMFKRDFMEYHSDRFNDFSLIFRDDKNRIISLLPANITESILYSHQGLTFGGFLTNSKMTASTMLDVFNKLLEYLKPLHIKKIIYKCIPYIYSSLPNQEDLYAIFIANGSLIRRDVSSTILMSQPITYSKGRKWGINRAKKNDVEIAKFEKASLAWPLIREVLNNYYETEPTHTEKEIDFLQSKFPENITAYYAHIHNAPVAVAITFDTDLVAHTQYLAVNNEGREVAALDYLIDQIIEDKKNKVTYFDFGISNEDSGRYLNEGLISQKEGFGARAVVHDFYEIEIK